MLREGIVVILVGVCSAMAAVPASPPVAAAAPVPITSIDLTQPRPSAMTGTVEQRNAVIGNVMDSSKGGRVQRIVLTATEMSTVVHIVGSQFKIDVEVQWDELKKQGIEAPTVTLDLHERTFPEIIEIILWQMRPTTGAVGWKIDGGKLVILPVADIAPAKETAAQRIRDVDIKTLLQQPFDFPDRLGTPQPFATLWRSRGQKKTIIDVIVDWKELEKIGIAADAQVTVDAKTATGEAVLQAALAGLKPTKGAVGYEIWGGIVRVSTRERLDREKPKAAATNPAMP